MKINLRKSFNILYKSDASGSHESIKAWSERRLDLTQLVLKTFRISQLSELTSTLLKFAALSWAEFGAAPPSPWSRESDNIPCGLWWACWEHKSCRTDSRRDKLRTGQDAIVIDASRFQSRQRQCTYRVHCSRAVKWYMTCPRSQIGSKLRVRWSDDVLSYVLSVILSRWQNHGCTQSRQNIANCKATF